MADDEARAAVEDGAGRRAVHLDHQRDRVAVAVVERRDVGPVVGHPPGRRRTGDEPPGVHEVRVEDRGLTRLVGDERAQPVGVPSRRADPRRARGLSRCAEHHQRDDGERPERALEHARPPILDRMRGTTDEGRAWFGPAVFPPSMTGTRSGATLSRWPTGRRLHRSRRRWAPSCSRWRPSSPCGRPTGPPASPSTSMQIGIRPLFMQSRLEDPVQKIMWGDEHSSKLAGADRFARGRRTAPSTWRCRSATRGRASP